MMNVVMIGEKIKSFREKQGLTQKELGSLCGMADSAIRKYESGAVKPKMTTVSRIAKALGVETLILTKDDPNYPITFSIPISELESTMKTMFGTDDIHRRISASLTKLNSTGQQKAVERVEELTKIPDYQKEKNPAEGD